MTTTVGWCTDLHLDFLSQRAFGTLIGHMNFTPKVEFWVCTGDVSNAEQVEGHLDFLVNNLSVPLFFVLGNHDFYCGSFEGVRKTTSKNHKDRYLTCSGPILINSDFALVGHDGWYDGGYSNWFADNVVRMFDYEAIKELNKVQHNKELLYAKLRDQARKATKKLRKDIIRASVTHRHIVVATHVPPFRENAVYNGEISNDIWLPNFSSKTMGDMLLDVASSLSETHKFTVLCGHSHGDAESNPLPNLRVLTGYSQYTNPWKSIKVLEL